MIQKKGIKWIKHKYHHKPQVPSTIYDLIVLTKTMLIQRLFYGANIIHLRGYPLGIPLVFLNWLFNYKVIFDIRGFWVDEKVDRDGWSKSSIKYKFLKFIEKRLFKMSDRIVTLTEMSKKIIQNVHDVDDKKISVIRTCADKIKPSKTKRDEKNEVISPTTRGKRLILSSWPNVNKNSIIAAIVIAGIPKRKENFAASLLSHPDKSAVEIVMPDLETPGTIANACARPINKLSTKL